jgi:hypothetical protein
MNADDPKELFDPAINGTLGVLKSIKKNNPDVQRVVITRYDVCHLIEGTSLKRQLRCCCHGQPSQGSSHVSSASQVG